MAEAFPTIMHLLDSRVARLALCIRGTLGKGTLRMFQHTRDRLHTNQHLCLDDAENTATLCAQRAGHSITPQQTTSANGPRLAAQREQGAIGPKMKCGRRWSGGPIDQRLRPRRSNTLPRKYKRNFARTRLAWSLGTQSKTTHPHSLKYPLSRPFHTSPRRSDRF